jgi:hypothetical protein
MNKNSESSGCSFWVVIGIIGFLIFGFALNHLSDEVKKLDGPANFILGIIVCGLFYGLIYFAMFKDKK